MRDRWLWVRLIVVARGFVVHFQVLGEFAAFDEVVPCSKNTLVGFMCKASCDLSSLGIIDKAFTEGIFDEADFLFLIWER